MRQETTDKFLFTLTAWKCERKLGSHPLCADYIDIFAVSLDNLFDD